MRIEGKGTREEKACPDIEEKAIRNQDGFLLLLCPLAWL
jgi:hypothetical protein